MVGPRANLFAYSFVEFLLNPFVCIHEVLKITSRSPTGRPLHLINTFRRLVVDLIMAEEEVELVTKIKA